MKLTTLTLVTLLSLSHVAIAETTWDAAERTKDGKYQVSGNWSELNKDSDTLQLKVTDVDGDPVTQGTIKVDYDSVSMPMGSPNTPVIEMGEGVYTKEIKITMDGTWRFNISVKKNGTKDKLVHDKDF